MISQDVVSSIIVSHEQKSTPLCEFHNRFNRVDGYKEKKEEEKKDLRPPLPSKPVFVGLPRYPIILLYVLCTTATAKMLSLDLLRRKCVGVGCY